MISGEPVYSETSVRRTPASRSVRAVPPVDRISTPIIERPRANSTMPVLSVTLIRAVLTFMGGRIVRTLPDRVNVARRC